MGGQADGISPTIVGGSWDRGGGDLGPQGSVRAWAKFGVNGRALADDMPSAEFVWDPSRGADHMLKLTVDQVAALQGFPPHWTFEGRKTARYRQVGNATPPPFAHALGLAMRSALSARWTLGFTGPSRRLGSRVMPTDQREPTVPRRADMVDLFAGPGGLDVAARWLGLDVYGFEWDRNACATRGAAGLNDHPHDVRHFGPQDVPGAWILAGGPPCQTFTVAGSGAGRKALDEVLGFVDRMGANGNVSEILPGWMMSGPDSCWSLCGGRSSERGGDPYKVIVLEQVPAVLPVWERMADVSGGLEYKVDRRRSPNRAVRRTADPPPRHLIASLEGGTQTSDTDSPARTAKASTERVGERGAICPGRQWVPTRPGYDFQVISNYGTGGNPKLRGRRRGSRRRRSPERLAETELVDAPGFPDTTIQPSPKQVA